MSKRRLLALVLSIALVLGCVIPFTAMAGEIGPLAAQPTLPRYVESNGELNIPVQNFHAKGDVDGLVWNEEGGVNFINNWDGRDAGDEYMEYNVTIATAGTYDVTMYLGGEARSVMLCVDGNDVKQFNIAGTTDWEDLDAVTEAIDLTAGDHTIRLSLISGWGTTIGGNLEFAIQSSGNGGGGNGDGGNGGNGGNNGDAIIIPVEDYDQMTSNPGQPNPPMVVNPIPNDPNGEKYVGEHDLGDYLEYTVDIPTTGKYDVSVFVSTAVDPGAGFRMYIDSKDNTPLNFLTTRTTAWDRFDDKVTNQAILTAGQHKLYVGSIGGWCNIGRHIEFKFVEAVELSDECDVTAVTTPAGATIDGTNINAEVANDVDTLVVDVTVSEGAEWGLYSDEACEEGIYGNEIYGMEVGANKAYIKVIAEDGVTSKVYTLTINRLEEGQQPGNNGGNNGGGNGDGGNNGGNGQQPGGNIGSFGQSTAMPYVLAALAMLVAGAVVVLSIYRRREAR